MLEIFQKVHRTKSARVRKREDYHIYRQLDKIPTRYKKYQDLSDEEKAVWKENVRKSQAKRRKNDPKYRQLLSYRAREYYQRTHGQYKICSKCDKRKGYIAFDLRDPKNPTPTLRGECKECRKKYNKERYDKTRRVHRKERV